MARLPRRRVVRKPGCALNCGWGFKVRRGASAARAFRWRSSASRTVLKQPVIPRSEESRLGLGSNDCFKGTPRGRRCGPRPRGGKISPLQGWSWRGRLGHWLYFFRFLNGLDGLLGLLLGRFLHLLLFPCHGSDASSMGSWFQAGVGFAIPRLRDRPAAAKATSRSHFSCDPLRVEQTVD